MVRLSCPLSKSRTFYDTVRILARGGRGGNGLPKYGGVGGKGGDVYMEAVEEYTIKKLKLEFPQQKFVGGPGEDSKRFRVLGNPGVDVVIKCPPGVSAITDNKIIIGEVNHPGEKVLLAKGGIGGGPDNGFIGQKGQAFPVMLDLKLLADVGFVGFPNAGKSTLLKALSNAKPKIASYPFTTIQPNLGIICYKDFRKITAADLPGLIDGAHMNYGMGHKFLKHCVRTQVLLFVVDIDGFRLNPMLPHRNALETILFLNKELEMYDDDLVYKPAILAINKMDTDFDGTKFAALKEGLQNLKRLSQTLHSERRPQKFVKFDAVLPISAKHGSNIELLKDKIRTIIDIYHEEKQMKLRQVTVSTNPEYDVIYA